MAAALAAVRTYFEQTLQIDDESVRDALVAEGLNHFDVFITLTDKEIKTICDNCRTPGGTIPNPAYDAANNPNVAQHIRDPGARVGHITYTRLRKLRYYCYALHRVGRTFVRATATLARLEACWERFLHEDEYDVEPKLPPKLEKVKDVWLMIENLTDHFAQKHGGHKAPLSYVIREDDDIPAVADDEPFGEPSHDEELERRLPHTGMIYKADNTAVWGVIRQVTNGGPAWPWVQSHARSQNGRAAFLALRAHYLGSASQNCIKLKADADLETAFFDNNRNFTHEDYCQLIIRAINDLREANEEMPVSKQVRIYLNGIKDSRLAATKHVALGLPAVTESLEACMSYMSQQIAMLESYAASGKQRRIAGVSGGSAGVAVAAVAEEMAGVETSPTEVVGVVAMDHVNSPPMITLTLPFLIVITRLMNGPRCRCANSGQPWMPELTIGT